MIYDGLSCFAFLWPGGQACSNIMAPAEGPEKSQNGVVLVQSQNHGPLALPLIWNRYIPVICHLRISAHTLNPTQIRKKQKTTRLLARTSNL